MNRRRNPIIPIRWVKDENSTELTLENQPADRALNVLFMATSPRNITELDFEAEEAKILLATKRKPLSLIVEESGCLTELGHLVEDYEKVTLTLFTLLVMANLRMKNHVLLLRPNLET